jgi:Exopolysaccharide biosynthesis protein related to N-acetylglucosamine-1-phosphodiester alpha-N-acetylglucosaminidase
VKNFKRWIFNTALTIILLFTFHINVLAANLYVFYEQKQEKLITKNLVYSVYNQITSEGMRDFYVLRVPLNDPNITVKSVESLKEYGLKETAQTLLSENNAIAGVNGDFFGMQGNYSAAFGTVINNGNLISLNSNINAQKGEYSSFYIDNDNNPFMAYIKSEVTFLNDGKKSLDIAYVNKITDMVYPTYIDRNSMDNTKSLDKRFPGLVKLVISNDEIVYISKKSENVDVPEDGYIITMSSHTADYNLDKFKVGQKTEFNIKSSVDLSKIKTMFGGVGRILINGKVANDNGIVVKGRQPRTALGLTFDRNTLIIIVVDGRSHSIGATQEEMAQLMQRFGAYNAMHLDGGGSTTMVVQDLKTENLNVVNTLSDGLQRKVVNAVGIFKPTQVGELNSIEIVPEYNKFLLNVPCKLKVYGYDEYLNKIEIPQENVAIIADDEGGIIENGVFYASKVGKLKLLAQYENFTSEKEIVCSQINCIEPAQDVLNAKLNSQTDLIINAIDDDGVKTRLDNSNIKFSVVPESLGKIENGKFNALTLGKGYIACSFENANENLNCYIKVVVANEKNTTANEIKLPDSKKFHDKLNVNFTNENMSNESFDVFCVGNMYISEKSKPSNYKENINKYLTLAKQNCSLGLFVGNVDAGTDTKIFKQQNNYSINTFKNLTVASMTAKSGSLFKTNIKQWEKFETDIKNKNSDHIIIMLDKNPATLNPQKEYELFHCVLKKFVDNGKTVFVLYSTDSNTQSTVKDGVRYINIGSLYKSDKSLNQNYKSLKFRVTGKNIVYKFE